VPIFVLGLNTLLKGFCLLQDFKTPAKVIGAILGFIIASAYPAGFIVTSVQLAGWYAPSFENAMSSGLYLATLVPTSIVNQKTLQFFC